MIPGVRLTDKPGDGWEQNHEVIEKARRSVPSVVVNGEVDLFAGVGKDRAYR